MSDVDEVRVGFLYSSDRCPSYPSLCDERANSLLTGSSTKSSPRDPHQSEQAQPEDAVRSTRHYKANRYLLLALLSVIKFVTYFVYESPGSLEEKIINVLQVDTATYDLLFSAVSWPNIVLCLFGGVVLDKWLGLRMGLMVLTSVCTLGQLLATTGVLINNFVLVTVGRTIFGGGESLVQVATDCIAASWFAKSELSFVFGVMYSSAQFGSMVGLTVNDPLYTSLNWISSPSTRLGMIFFVGFGATVIMLACSGWAVWIDYTVKKKMGRRQDKTGHQFSLNSCLNFPTSLWLLQLLAMSYYAVNFPFITIAQMFFEMKYGLPTVIANTANAMIYGIAAVLSPFLGSMIDKTGRHLYWALAGILLGLACHILLILTGNTYTVPFLASILYGISYALFNSSVWPMSAMLVDESQLGTAYGIFQSSLNLGYGSIDLVAGRLVDSSGYLILELFFTLLLLLSLAVVTVLFVSDISDGNKLSAPKFRGKDIKTSSNNDSTGSKTVVSWQRDQQSNETTRIAKRNVLPHGEKNYGSFAVHSI